MIKDNLTAVLKDIAHTAAACGRDPNSIKLVAVSKRFPVEAILEARESGQVLFGENYLQEAAEKKAQLKDRVQFHFIGHLQSNKARVAAEIFDMIETVDRTKIASALDRHLQQLNKKLAVLIQVNIGYDSVKSGVLPEQAATLLKDISRFKNLQPRGLMTMPPFTDDLARTRRYFRDLRCLAQEAAGQRTSPRKAS